MKKVIILLSLFCFLFSASPVFAYVVAPDYRSSSTCSWYLDPSIYNNLGGDAVSAVIDGANAWTQAGSNFGFVRSTGVVDNKVRYGSVPFGSLGTTVHNHYWWSLWATEYTVSTLSDSFSWNTGGYMDGPNGIADVRTVAEHEFGHWLVLDHDPNHTEAVMWPESTVTKWNLRQDDINGIIAIWGSI